MMNSIERERARQRMGIHDGHRDRQRDRFLQQGLASFEDHNALELLLFYARPRCDTNEIAHALIGQFGSFSAVLDAPVEELAKVKGVGKKAAVLLKMVPELAAYYLNCRASAGTILNSTESAGAYFLPKFVGKINEEVFVASLDDKRKVLNCTSLGQVGIVNAVSLPIRKIVTEAVSANATGILLAHNHPSGVAIPSSSDKWVTRHAYQALNLINVELVDHIIVAGDDYVSLADSGFFEMLRRDATHT